jgi:basic membrane lipoprotein Med (substrate-binding protein (PBP1-ABC) superfamily)
VALLFGCAVLVAACGDGGDRLEVGDFAGVGAQDPNRAVEYEGACESGAADKLPEGFKVGYVTDIGKIDDRTFNQFSYEGMRGSEACYGHETSFIETVSEADYEQNISTILDFEPKVVITNGFLMADATKAAAEANPDVYWIGIDQFHEDGPDNYIWIQFREDQSGFLAGAIAGLMTQSNVVGVVGGREDVPPVVRFVNAYAQGAEFVNPDVEVLQVYNESFTDPAKGASDAAQMIGEGADVIFGAGGKTGSGAVQEATKQQVWGIGVDQDEYYSTFNGGEAEGSEYLVNSAVKRVDLAIMDEIRNAINGTWQGGLLELSLANDRIQLAGFHDADVPAEVATQIADITEQLTNGEIDTGVCPIDGLPLTGATACDE